MPDPAPGSAALTASGNTAVPLPTESGHCVFCERIKAHEFDVQWTDAVAFKPLNPVTPGHTLIVSRFHVEDFAQDAETAMLTMKWASYYAYSVGDCNIITSVGAAATQTIRHLHVHVVPRREGDGLALPWTGQEVLRPKVPASETCSGCGGPLADEVWLPLDQLVTDESVFCSSTCALARQKELTRD